jgi:hypothetical protein
VISDDELPRLFKQTSLLTITIVICVMKVEGWASVLVLLALAVGSFALDFKRVSSIASCLAFM